jgi:hypothetical protein
MSVAPPQSELRSYLRRLLKNARLARTANWISSPVMETRNEPTRR